MPIYYMIEFYALTVFKFINVLIISRINLIINNLNKMPKPRSKVFR